MLIKAVCYKYFLKISHHLLLLIKSFIKIKPIFGLNYCTVDYYIDCSIFGFTKNYYFELYSSSIVKIKIMVENDLMTFDSSLQTFNC